MKEIFKITIIDPKNNTEKPVLRYELRNGYLIIPDLGYAYIFDPSLVDMTKPFYYTDSVFPLDKPTEQIIRKYIKVEVKSCANVSKS